jgi:hypothetical protein
VCTSLDRRMPFSLGKKRRLVRVLRRITKMPSTINILAVRRKTTLLHDVSSQPDITTTLVHYSSDFVVAQFFRGWLGIEINDLSRGLRFTTRSRVIASMKEIIFFIEENKPIADHGNDTSSFHNSDCRRVVTMLVLLISSASDGFLVPKLFSRMPFQSLKTDKTRSRVPSDSELEWRFH